MCLIHSIVKGRKIDAGLILHQEIADCATKQTGILVFQSLVMLLWQQKGIVPSDDEEVLDNKGLINESFIERMTHGKDTQTMKEEKTRKTRKGKTKLSPIPLREFPVLPLIIRDYELSSKDHDLGDRDKSVASPPIVNVFIDEKEEESRDIKECKQRIDSIIEGDFIAG
ncbi:hypothetical protein PVK06_040180 [Gossypium arboreum]|uniref:Uncharacterized protein n=1 Tax=Gossypium arboreum TaxID=29729 RepID=A0ABR0N4R8_GOSAR|nr:hypothetical protein PVK06_040180 [Gossypium arboreum]